MASQKEKEEEGDYMDMSGLVTIDYFNTLNSNQDILWVRYVNFICMGLIWIS